MMRPVGVLAALGLLALAMTPIGAGALAGTWTRESGIRVDGGVVPYVVTLPDGSYRMYYRGDGISSALSTDGLTFTKESGSRLGPGEERTLIERDWFVTEIVTDV